MKNNFEKLKKNHKRNWKEQQEFKAAKRGKRHRPHHGLEKSDPYIESLLPETKRNLQKESY